MSGFETGRVGIIGLGNMGGAIAAGLENGGFDLERLVGFDPAADTMARFGGVPAESAGSLVLACDVVIVAVKPHLLPDVLTDAFADASCSVLISVAAGVELDTLRSVVGSSVEGIVRAMPNTAAAVGCSTSALVAEEVATAEHRTAAEALFATIGEVAWVAREDLMHVSTAVVGSAPAFVYVMAEALADAAVLEGLPRVEARRLVGSMIRGAGELLLAHAGSPAELKDAVTSPGGTTIRGIEALEDGGFRAALMDAVVRTTSRSKELA